MLVYKIDVLGELKSKGYTSYRLLNEKLLSSSALNKIRQGEMIGINVLEKICDLLKCQPSKIIMWVEDKEEN